MIETTTKKIYFTEYIPHVGKVKNTDKPPQIRVNVKQGTIAIGTRTSAILHLHDKFLKFYVDVSKKVIGFTVHSSLPEKLLMSKKYRIVKPNSTGQAIMSIRGILNQFQGLKNTYKCDVKKYVETSGILDKGDTYYYIQLDDAYEHHPN